MRSRRPDTPLSALAERIASSAVVSCDVFDTAVMRQLARPEDVLLAAGARIVAAGHATVSAAAFREIRLAVEHVVRTQAHADGRDEVTLNAIYQHLHATGVVGDPEAAARLEFEAECTACVAVEPMREVLTALRPGQRLIFASDTSLPGEWIAELLERCGYPPGTCVFTSADLGLGKHTGRMFPAIAEALGCRPADIVHIGDNPVSDLANAEAAGFRTVHLPCALPRPERERIAAQEPVLRLMHSHRRSRAARSEPQDPGAPALHRYATLLLIGFSSITLVGGLLSTGAVAGVSAVSPSPRQRLPGGDRTHAAARYSPDGP